MSVQRAWWRCLWTCWRGNRQEATGMDHGHRPLGHGSSPRAGEVRGVSVEAPSTASASSKLSHVPVGDPGLWSTLVDMPGPFPGDPTTDQLAWLVQVDQRLHQLEDVHTLVPRAPAVTPQLLAILRQASPSIQALSLRLQQDAGLASEVLRMARSPFYGSSRSVDTLEAALQLIGFDGFRLVLSRTLLRPIYSVQGEHRLTARAAPRAWAQAEQLAQRAATLAIEHDLDRHDAYLLGLLDPLSRLALLRLIEREGYPLEWPLTQGMDAELTFRSRRLLVRLLSGWTLSPSLARVAEALQGTGPALEGTWLWLHMQLNAGCTS